MAMAMRGPLRFALLTGSLVLASAACSGGGDDDDDGFDPGPVSGTLTTGTYDISHWDGGADECRTNQNLNGEQVEVTVVGTSLSFSSFGGVIHGSSFALSQTGEYDFTAEPYPFGIGPFDCVLDIAEDVIGQARGNDRATVERTIGVTVATGAECNDVEDEISDLAGGSVSFPCTSESDFFMEKQ